MIVYALQCDAGHRFDAWFRNSDAFDAQAAQDLVICPDCGSHSVEKALMAPRLGRSGSRALTVPEAAPETRPSVPVPQAGDGGSTLAALPEDPRAAFRRKLVELRQIVERNFDNVGSNFAEEARKIHYREADPRGIFGTASAEDAEALRDEGIEFGALPWPSAGEN